MKKYFAILLIITGSVSIAQPLDPGEEEITRHERNATVQQQQPSYESIIVAAFKAGNATKIASYFAENVDLSILETENLYSKSQAEQILKNFFLKHKPSDFTIVHKGKSGQSEYFIGELTCEDALFRVTLNSKSVDSSKEISALTIEVN
ncbi:MAG: DUF4783 domain-containing protein [Crocinitomicaceae bacterium]|nr:DUF4783 domain-containing protein [Crocinitomicaceae bacterium]